MMRRVLVLGCFAVLFFIITTEPHSVYALETVEESLPIVFRKNVTRYQVTDKASYDLVRMISAFSKEPLPLRGVKFNIYSVELTDIYYDTPQLSLYLNGGSVSIRHVKDVMSGRNTFANRKETVHVRSLYGELEREDVYGYASYGRVIAPFDKHELIGRVKRIQRQHFVQNIIQSGVDIPEKLTPIVEVLIHSLCYRIEYKKKVLFEINVEKNKAVLFGIKKSFYNVEMSSFEENFSDLDINTKEYVHKLRDLVTRQLGGQSIEQFPHGQSSYAFLLNSYKEFFPGIVFLIRYPLVYQCIQALFFILLGSAVLVIFFYKRIVKKTV